MSSTKSQAVIEYENAKYYKPTKEELANLKFIRLSSMRIGDSIRAE